MEWEFNSYYTLIAATLVLLIGKVLVNKVKFLRDFNIPEPVAGGLIAAIVLFALHQAYGVSFKLKTAARCIHADFLHFYRFERGLFPA